MNTHIQKMSYTYKIVSILVGATVLGAVAGYLLEQNAKYKSAGQPVVFDLRRLIVFVIFGLIAGAAAFVLMTEGREVKASDYILSCFVAMKGAEWLERIGNSVINSNSASVEKQDIILKDDDDEH